MLLSPHRCGSSSLVQCQRHTLMAANKQERSGDDQVAAHEPTASRQRSPAPGFSVTTQSPGSCSPALSKHTSDVVLLTNSGPRLARRSRNPVPPAECSLVKTGTGTGTPGPGHPRGPCLPRAFCFPFQPHRFSPISNQQMTSIELPELYPCSSLPRKCLGHALRLPSSLLISLASHGRRQV